MKKKLTAIVSPKDDNLKLETFLKARLLLAKNEISRAKFRENGICVNGERTRTSALLKTGDLVEILLESEQETSGKLPASGGELSILYEDSDVIILDKPAGISVHPAGKNSSDTLANRLAYCLRNKKEDSVIRIFGRLDQDTSGVVLAVKNRPAATRLERQREKHILYKSYLAITDGIPDPPSGKITVPLAPDPENRRRMCVTPEGKPAVTRYETLMSREGHALIRLRLETGRTHQIRVHMASVGCPLLGDPLYGSDAVLNINRTALHAQTIHFLQPFTGEALEVKAPLPEDFHLALRSLGFSFPGSC